MFNIYEMKKTFILSFLKFFFLVILSILMGLSSSNYISMWMSFEINFYSFLPMLVNMNLYESEKSIMIYFWSQSIASNMIIMMILSMKIMKQEEIMMIMICSFLCFKMALFPFQFWILFMIDKMSWFMTAFILSIQKFLPIIMISLVLSFKNFLFLIFLNSLVSSLSGLKTFSMRKIMVFSSMNHVSMMLLSLMFSKKTCYLYLLVYSFMNFFLYKPLEKMNLSFIFQTFLKNKSTLNFTIMITLINLMGMPPFIGFIPKSMVMIFLTQSGFLIMSFLILMTNVMSSYFYLRFMLSNMILSMNDSSYKFNSKFSNLSFFLIFPFFSNFLMMWNFKLKNY